MICSDAHGIYYTYEGEELEHYALTHDMTMNIVYTARVVSDRVNDAVEKSLDKIRSGAEAPDQKTIYVFLDGNPDNTLPLNYYDINGYTVGITSTLQNQASR